MPYVLSEGMDLFAAIDVSRRENAFSVMWDVRGTPHFAIATAGLPCTSVIGGTDFVTTLPAATTAPRPITTFGEYYRSRAYEDVFFNLYALGFFEMGNHGHAHAEQRTILDRNKIGARGIEYHVIANPDIFSNMDSASSVQFNP